MKCMKRNYLFYWFAVLLLLFSSVQSYAEVYSGSCGKDVNWTLDTETGLLEITGSGDMKDYDDYHDNSPWYYYRFSIKKCTIKNGVTSIGEYAFYKCTGLTNITIPNSVTSIGSFAFYGCTGLTSITWNAISCTSFSSSTFDGIKENITSFTFGDKVQTIPARICYGMSNLTNITIPESVTSIGDYAFSGCTGLTNITIPKSVTSIGSFAFRDCTGLTGVIMGKGVTSIGMKAFSNNSNLVSITCYSQTSPEAGRFAFKGISKEAILYYPKGSDYSVWASNFAQMIEMDETDIDTPKVNDSKKTVYDIYDMNGRLVRKAATTTDGLKAGLYIINGKNILVK